jgi:lambda repressor-like predicted transcriptional regulator
MEDLKRAKLMERVLRDMKGEGNSVATLAKRFSLSEESIRTVLGIGPEEPEPQSRSILARLRKRLGFYMWGGYDTRPRSDRICPAHSELCKR